MRWKLGLWGAALCICAACGQTTNGKARVGDDGGILDPWKDGTGGKGNPNTSNYFVDVLKTAPSDKLDLLFMIDNSIAMKDKQDLFVQSLPDFVAAFVNPPCVDQTGAIVSRPSDPTEACPGGWQRAFPPIGNIHVGVITSSLGDHGDGYSCLGVDNDPTDPTLEQQDDHAHLIATRPRFAQEHDRNYAGQAYQPADPQGFLDWNPAARGGTQDIDQFVTTFQMMVTASGEYGCGLEAQLESVHRFLSDPSPPAQIQKQPCPGTTEVQKQPCAVPTGKDDALLQERAAFLRPDSTVVVTLLTDENDCSIRDTQQFFYAARQDIVLPSGSTACFSNPNDPCCYSCAASPPAGCQADPACANKPDATLDPINLRCFDEKRRFGLNFLYPVERYENALRAPRICTSRVDLAFDVGNPAGTCPDADGDAQPDVVQNPLFANPNGLPRSPSQVIVAGIVGVPWQDIVATTDASGNPYPPNELHYLTAAELSAARTWDLILGDPAASPPRMPTDGLMVESRSPRAGVDVTGKPIPGPNAQPSEDNGINHHDWSNGANDDLMYACIMPLPASRNCAEVEKQHPAPGCDCGSASVPGDNNPLCAAPGTVNYGATQYSSKAYPGLRELQLLKGLGTNAVVTSICARNVVDSIGQDFGYAPALASISKRVGENFVGAGCLPRALGTDPSGHVPCKVVEVATTPTTCDPARGRTALPDSLKGPIVERLGKLGICGGSGAPSCSAFEMCVLAEAGPNCHKAQQPETGDVPGWCYVDPAENPNDDAALVARCPAASRRIVRFVDPESQTPAPGSVTLLACEGSPASP